MDNVEKVWLAETKLEKEKRRTEELQKKIIEERQIHELRQLQVESSGGAVKAVDTTMDWMYEGPGSYSDTQRASEDYLLGKMIESKGNKVLRTSEFSTNQSSSWSAQASSNDNTFTRLHEDPMLVMKKAEKKARDCLILNSVTTARLHSGSWEEGKTGEGNGGKEKGRSKEEGEKKKKKKTGEKKKERREGKSMDYNYCNTRWEEHLKSSEGMRDRFDHRSAESKRRKIVDHNCLT